MDTYRTHGSITLFPVFHNRLEFASEVRAALLADPPDAVAVELPATWSGAVWQAVNRLPYLSVILSGEEDDGLFVAVEPTDPSMEALRTAKELGVAAHMIDLDVNHYPQMADPAPDTYPIHRVGYDRVMAHLLQKAPFARLEEDEARETMMAHALQELSAGGQRVVCVLGAAHLAGVMEKLKQPQPRPLSRAKPRKLRLFNWSANSMRSHMSEPPYLAAAYEAARHPRPEGPNALPAKLDRVARTEQLLRDAVSAYSRRVGEDVSTRQLSRLGSYAHRYALQDNMLVPDLFQLVVAARGMVDDDYAREVWEEGSRYPWLDETGLLPTLDLEKALRQHTRRVVLRGRMRRERPPMHRLVGKPRLKERRPGEWKAQWSGDTICSHVPEDLIIEEYGRQLKSQASGLLSSKESKVEPFMASLKDGVDVRETLRHWHTGKLYVKELPVSPLEVGAVVVIFDEDLAVGGPGLHVGEVFQGRYPWLITWLGEHSQESDMALYASPPGENVVGPGISRCEYGGFMLSYPPMRMMDVWSDPYFDVAQSKAERLLLAGLDYSKERNVVYVAERPPRPLMHTIANRLGRQIIYMPLGQIAKATLKKVRHFHVLAGHHVRDYVQDYVKK